MLPAPFQVPEDQFCARASGDLNGNQFPQRSDPWVGCYVSDFESRGSITKLEPHPTCGSGATRSPSIREEKHEGCFNPHPTRGSGATRRAEALRACLVMVRVLLGRTKCLYSPYLRFSINYLIFSMFSALAEENWDLTSFVFNMFSALAFY